MNNIVLCAAESVYGDVERNFQTLKKCVENAEKGDLIVFGEAFLQGFGALNFDYGHDIKIALAQKSVEIVRIMNFAKAQSKGMAFGYYENDDGAIYSSYMIISDEGKILGNYRRVSAGWKESFANADYREGESMMTVRYDDKVMGVAVCGDLWEDDLLQQTLDMDEKSDFILWPVHCDYDEDFWEKSEKREYAARSAIWQSPLLFVNNFVPNDPDSASGGACVFYQGRIVQELPMGSPGALEVKIT